LGRIWEGFGKDLGRMIVIVQTALELGYGVNGKMKRRRLKVRDLDDVVLLGTKLKLTIMCFGYDVGSSIVVCIVKS
jgi:hypothetical protein